MSKLDAATPGTLRVRFESGSPELERLLNALGEYSLDSPCRYEMEAHIFEHLAKMARKEAQRLTVRRHELHGHS